MSYFKTVLKKKKKRKIKKNKYQKRNRKINTKEVIHNRLKSKKKVLRYEPAKNLENCKEQTARLQKCFAENGMLKRSFVITKQELKSWKLIK